MVETGPKEALEIRDLVSFERKGPFIALNFPSRIVNFGIMESQDDLPKLINSDDAPDDFFENDPHIVNLSEENDGPFLLVDADIKTATLQAPFTMSEGSQAKYLIKKQIDGMMLLFQYLDGQSSRHVHNGDELFLPFDERRPCYGKNANVFDVTDFLWIEKGTYHEAFSRDEPTLTIIVQPFDVQHIPVGRSNLEEMRIEAEQLV